MWFLLHIKDITHRLIPARYELEQITIPTLVISAADDLFGTFDGARYTAEHIPRARFIGYSSGGHLLVGHQKEITSEIEMFLK
jgi:2-hydroxy-6-oxonona-2,4-dienedioate hydrolase